MKKFLMIAVALMALGIAAFATSSTYTNQQGQVVTVTVGDDGVTTSVAVSTPGLAYRTELGLVGIRLNTNTSFSADATTTGYGAYKPRDIGDILIQTVSNFVFVATGMETSDWVQVSN